jgi:hypothetical protein
VGPCSYSAQRGVGLRPLGDTQRHLGATTRAGGSTIRTRELVVAGLEPGDSSDSSSAGRLPALMPILVRYRSLIAAKYNAVGRRYNAVGRCRPPPEGEHPRDMRHGGATGAVRPRPGGRPSRARDDHAPRRSAPPRTRACTCPDQEQRSSSILLIGERWRNPTPSADGPTPAATRCGDALRRRAPSRRVLAAREQQRTPCCYQRAHLAGAAPPAACRVRRVRSQTVS